MNKRQRKKYVKKNVQEAFNIVCEYLANQKDVDPSLMLFFSSKPYNGDYDNSHLRTYYLEESYGDVPVLITDKPIKSKYYPKKSEIKTLPF